MRGRRSYRTALITVVLAASAYGAAMEWRTVNAAEDSPAGTAAPGSGYAVVVNGAGLKLDTPARLEGSTLLVPIRAIAEALGARVTYEETTGSVTAEQNGRKVLFRIGSAEAECDGETVRLDTAVVQDGETTMVPLRFFSETFGTVVKWNGADRLVTIDDEARLLPAVGSYDHLQKLLKEQEEAYGSVGYGMIDSKAPTAASGAAEAKSVDLAAAAPEHSGTNVQTAGVDEADVVKTDGSYIYEVSGNRIRIVQAGGDSLRLVSSLPMEDLKLSPLELYLNGDTLTVIGLSDVVQGGPSPGLTEKMIVRPRSTKVKTVVLDIADREYPKAVKEVETEGEYVTSRMVGSDLYVITNRWLDRYAVLSAESTSAGAAPAVRDSAIGERLVPVDFGSIRYMPGSSMESYMVIAGIDTSRPDREAHFSVYLGSAKDVYGSEQHLYAAQSLFRPFPSVMGEGAAASADGTPGVRFRSAEPSTVVYKFRMKDGEVRFVAEGEVPGTVLNRFSMDEYEGSLRIATTSEQTDSDGKFATANQVYVLDESLGITGHIRDIAPGERIYSVRFMGKRGYVVTFKQVDPLFVLDLADPTAPSVLGKLKIPGYSDYLQPYDDTHLIGIGKDAVSGKDNGVAYYQGMKLALFDVGDATHPVQLFSASIGDRGTDSEVLRNPKALLFSKEKDLLALPVTVMELPESQRKEDPAAYGHFAFQGAYIYKLNLQDGFVLRGKPTHLSEEDLLKAGDGGYAGEHNIKRILYIGDRLYTLSPSEIRSYSLDTLTLQDRLEMPE